MLPTKGYFQDIECPYFNNSCGRPYCHFRHRKKQQDLMDDGSNEESHSKDVPTYKPTPKSELAVNRSHIPISYVPDIIYRAEKPSRTTTIPKTSFLSKPTYKPTPISILTSAVKSGDENEDDVAVNEIKQSMANTKYSPEAGNVSEYNYKPTSLKDKSIDENLKKQGYEPVGDHKNNVSYNPTALDDIIEQNSSDVVYKPTSDNIGCATFNYKPSPCLENSDIDFENLDSEFDMIDEIINMSDKTKIDLEVIQKQKNKNIKDVDASDIVCEDLKRGLTLKSNTKSHKHTKIKEINSDKKVKHSDKKDNDSDKKVKHDVKNHKHSAKDNSKHKVSSTKHVKENDRHAEKSKEERSSKEKCSEKNKDAVINVEKSNKKDKKKDRDHSSSSRDHDKNKRSREKNEKEKESKHDKRGSSKDKIRTKHSKHKDKDKHRHSKTDDKSKKKLNHSESTKHSKDTDKCMSLFEAKVEEKVKDTHKDKSKLLLDYCEIDSFDVDIDLDNDDETMRECYKIFKEYSPAAVPEVAGEKEEIIESKDEISEEQITSKKRVAHSNAPSTSAKFQVPKPAMPTPGLIMNNRLKTVKALQANNEGKFIAEEIKRVTKRPAPFPSIVEAAKKHKLQQKFSTSSKPRVSLIDEILSDSKISKPIKIAPVANVINIQRAKAQLEELNKKRAAEQVTKTVAQTNKVGKRQAHVPDYSLNDIPDVLDAEKSKLPVNVRTRFLTMLADECCKLYMTQADAYKRALDEEYGCYQKCKVLVTYRNSAMLAVNRIRKEVQEREQKNLGPLGSGESSLKSEGNLDKHRLYQIIDQYVLTEEELDIHGYPRESDQPGRAIIKNRKVLSTISLPKNQRKCARCSKIYLVDDKGKVIYEEECVYHPLKKRTIRGEQMYLCCKSGDDSGCATSNTHVCEMSDNLDLEGFQTTMSPESENDPRSSAVYALDCEMCYTTRGLELTRVTIVDTNCKTVYESLVKPMNEIIDYNTRFSGITKQQMERVNTGILQVQANILHLCNSKTILIGHSLESDMKALKIVHSCIVDTSVLFPHKMGLPHKRALRALASEYLKKIIQNDVSGHDSAEDAKTCMELVKWKVKEDTKIKSVK